MEHSYEKWDEIEMYFGHLVIGNWHLAICNWPRPKATGNRQLEKGNRKLVIPQNGLNRQSGGFWQCRVS